MKEVMHKPERGCFVAGTDTDVGKTYVAVRYVRMLRERGIRVGAYKPVASGGVTAETSDAHCLWQALGAQVPIERVNRQSFTAPLAPPIAAEQEGRTVIESSLLDGVSAWTKDCDYLVVEGAGGLLSPISWSMTNADLARAIGYPLVLVASNRLGAVHQVLATVQAALTYELEFESIVLNDVQPSQAGDAQQTNLRLLLPFVRRLCPNVPVVRMQHGADKWCPVDQSGETRLATGSS